MGVERRRSKGEEVDRAESDWLIEGWPGGWEQDRTRQDQTGPGQDWESAGAGTTGTGLGTWDFWTGSGLVWSGLVCGGESDWSERDGVGRRWGRTRRGRREGGGVVGWG